jgi:hypothetical protein
MNDHDEERDDAPDEPQEGDYTTTDHVRFFQYGKLALTVGRDEDVSAALANHMEQQRFYADVWFVSDHGNAHRIDLEG